MFFSFNFVLRVSRNLFKWLSVGAWVLLVELLRDCSDDFGVGGPVVGFLFGEEQVVVEGDLEGPDGRKYDIFFIRRVKKLIFLGFDWNIPRRQLVALHSQLREHFPNIRGN